MKKLVALILGLMMLFACTAGMAEDYSDELYVQVGCMSNLDYFWDHEEGLRLAGEHFGVKTQYIAPSDYNLEEMVIELEQVIARKPAGLIVLGLDPVLDPLINKAIENGIPTVTVDADTPTSNRLAFIGTGNVNAGISGGKKLVDLLGGKGKVVVTMQPGQLNLEERLAGYMQVLEQYPEIEVVQVVDDGNDSIKAAEALAPCLLKYPDLDAIICVGAAGAPGAAMAVREAGKAGQVIIMGFDRGADVCEGIREGVITASVAQNTMLMPFYALDVLINYNHNQMPMTNDNELAGITGIPVNIDTGSMIIDQNNVEAFVR